ncbi:MAG TPA: hypothetical protein VHF25_12845 [Nitriliruptorales bacterium]|nr:hypothetical protein [Nitriliruptorales bacterium]
MASAHKLQFGAALAAVIFVSALVLRTSQAAFTATTENAGNAWAAGTVTLTDNDNGVALFSTSASTAIKKPGDSETKCIEVTYAGSLDPTSAIKLYAAVTDTDGAGGTGGTAAEKLSDNLDVAVTLGAKDATCASFGTGSSIYSGTLAAMPSTFAAGSSSWTPVLVDDPGTTGVDERDKVRAFRIQVTLNSGAPNDAQGDGSTANFTWEAQA